MKRDLERAREETRKKEEESRVVLEKEKGRKDGASETKGKRCTGERDLRSSREEIAESSYRRTGIILAVRGIPNLPM